MYISWQLCWGATPSKITSLYTFLRWSVLKVILCMELSMEFYPILLLTHSDTCSTCLHCSLSFHLLFSTCLFLSAPPFPVNVSKFGVSSGGGGGGGFPMLTAVMVTHKKKSK